jgi:two-component system nitrogen regulation response regulator NtrX
LGNVLADEGFKVVAASGGEEALKKIEEIPPDLVMLDIWMPGPDGLETLKTIKEKWPFLPVVMISGHGTVETAVKATKLGAFDFIEKPLSIEKVVLTIEHALEIDRLSRERKQLRQELAGADDLIGDSKDIRELREQIVKVAPTEGWVLITGENGTGKEVVARSIHRLSLRKDGPFVSVNCAAIPEELIESELFGYEKGAFTGAAARKPGKFDLADTGSIFLDEIGDMSLRTQSKILRILQEQQFERVGGAESIKVDVRVVAATNKNLEAAIKDGQFREDLYYRLNVIPIHLTPLRERKDDIPLFVEHFLKEFSLRSRLKPKSIDKKALAALMQYSWPGNVRELKNIIERAVYRDTTNELNPEDIDMLPGPTVSPAAGGFQDRVEAFERGLIEKALRDSRDNQAQAARSLGLSYHQFRYYFRKYYKGAN